MSGLQSNHENRSDGADGIKVAVCPNNHVRLLPGSIVEHDAIGVVVRDLGAEEFDLALRKKGRGSRAA